MAEFCGQEGTIIALIRMPGERLCARVRFDDTAGGKCWTYHRGALEHVGGSVMSRLAPGEVSNDVSYKDLAS